MGILDPHMFVVATHSSSLLHPTESDHIDSHDKPEHPRYFDIKAT
jgi:hypothetical protein